MTTIDLFTRFIPANHSVWALHAGRGKRQLPIFQEQSVVFLELPGFGALNDSFVDVRRVRQHVRMSDAIRGFPTAPLGTPPPSRNVLGYDDTSGTEGSFNAAVGNALSLYKDVRAGDLILVPGHGQYSRVLIGEVTSGFNPRHKLSLDLFGGEEVPTRAIRWLSSIVEKREFSRPTARSLENRHAIIEIQSAESKIEIYNFAYQNYSLGNLSKIDLNGPLYDSRDPSGILDAAFLTKFFVAAAMAYESGRIEEFSRLDARSATNLFYNPEMVKDFTFDFSSPGQIVVAIKTATVAILAALALTIMLSGTPVQEILGNLSLTNSANSIPIEQLNALDNGIHRLMDSIAPQIGEIADQAMRAKRDIGFDSEMKRLEP